MNCRTCGKANPEHIWYCKDHYKCMDCGTKDDLITADGGVYCHDCRDKKIKERITNFKGDTDYTNEIVCPHCGYKYGDSWEVTEGIDNCPDCDLKLEIVRDVEVTYCTSKAI
ncbi:MAG: hypothetical protein KZQ83_14735 [gamma proteobacterium symbiont of Taylorina sp.]|nr:hypothetical protein [gamma proteobacterium symbiont of Taylorina sp.]